MKIDNHWQTLLLKIRKKKPPTVVYVIGANDSGKSTFCQFLVKQLSLEFPTALIDCDPGQSILGPPTTIGMEIFPEPSVKRSTKYLHFIGSTTPKGYQIQTLTGIKKLTENAVALGAKKIIMDSCGYVLDYFAREFQFHIIDLIQPDCLITIENGNEISRWTNNFRRHPRIEVCKLKVSPFVTIRSPEERRAYRESRYREHFAGAISQQLVLKGIGFHGRIPELHNPDNYRNLVIALTDAKNYVITIGILQEIDLANKTMQIFSPRFDQADVAFIHFGYIYLNFDGKQFFP